MLTIYIKTCGPSVESLAGEPESPSAAAVPTKAINAILSKPRDEPSGINKAAIIGIVAKMIQCLT